MIWVDAICINQTDTAEKTQQVGLMAEIYSRAERTFAWIGQERDGSAVAMDVLEKVGGRMLMKNLTCESDKDSGSEPGKGDAVEAVKVVTVAVSAMDEFGKLTAGSAVGEWNLQFPEKLLQLVTDSMGKYLQDSSFPVVECRALLSRGYWSRMWIQQEVVISSRVVVCCGDRKVDWDVFEAGVVFIMLLAHHAVYGVISKYSGEKDGMRWDFSKWTDSERKNYDLISPGWSAEASALRRLRRRYPRDAASQPQSQAESQSLSPDEFSLMRVLAEAHSNSNVRYEASRHEDRIYGLAGMAADTPFLERFGFKVVYDVPCSESYADAARAIILSGGVDLLSLSNFPKLEWMPSWVPDWRMPIHRPRGGFPWETQFCATKDLNGPENTGHHVEWDDPLVLSGCIVDIVDHMNSPWRSGDVGSRLQPRLTRGYLIDLQNIIWMAGERQKKLGKHIYPHSEGTAALVRMPVADQLQAGTSVTPEEKTEYLAGGYLGVMKDLDGNFVRDARMWIAFRASFGVTFEGFPSAKDITVLQPTKDTVAEFNQKDSYYNMMNRQTGTRPFVGDKGYMGLVPDLAEKGDVVVIFRGAKFPYVLRKKINGKHGGKYELVGEAYVHGVMYGEYVADGPEFEEFELV